MQEMSNRVWKKPRKKIKAHRAAGLRLSACRPLAARSKGGCVAGRTCAGPVHARNAPGPAVILLASSAGPVARGGVEGLMTHPPRTKVRPSAGSGLRAVESEVGGKKPGSAVAKVIHHPSKRPRTLPAPRKPSWSTRWPARCRPVSGKTRGPGNGVAHPEWLVARWNRQFGRRSRENARNGTSTGAVYARWRIEATVPEFLAPGRQSGGF